MLHSSHSNQKISSILIQTHHWYCHQLKGPLHLPVNLVWLWFHHMWLNLQLAWPRKKSVSAPWLRRGLVKVLLNVTYSSLGLVSKCYGPCSTCVDPVDISCYLHPSQAPSRNFYAPAFKAPPLCCCYLQPLRTVLDLGLALIVGYRGSLPAPHFVSPIRVVAYWISSGFW